jgi:ribosomal protein S18 acetylase RimI-like enzyme
MPEVYSVLEPADIDDMVELLAQAFPHRDPPAIAVELTIEDFRQLVRVFSPTALHDGLTIVARDESSGKILGALLAEDFSSSEPDETSQLSPKFAPIFGILEELVSGYVAGRQIGSGSAVHIFLLGVSEAAAGKGVAKSLVTACLENAKKKGYSLAITEATNLVSQHIFRKLGFRQQGHGSYESFEYEGRNVFRSIADQGGPMIMEYLIQDLSAN